MITGYGEHDDPTIGEDANFEELQFDGEGDDEFEDDVDLEDGLEVGDGGDEWVEGEPPFIEPILSELVFPIPRATLSFIIAQITLSSAQTSPQARLRPLLSFVRF